MNQNEHLLVCLAEECAEISEQCSRLAVRISKALRFGLNEVQPGQESTNAERISAELADLLTLAEVLEKVGVITRLDVENKKLKLQTFINYAIQCGSLDAVDLTQLICAMCGAQATYVGDSKAIWCEHCGTGRWISKSKLASDS